MASSELRRLDHGRGGPGTVTSLRLPPRPVPGGMKRCSKCGEVKTVSEFHRDRCKASGLAPSCKECKSLVKRSRPATREEKDRANELRKLRYESDPAYREAVLARNAGQRRQWGMREKEMQRAYNAAMYAKRVALRARLQAVKAAMGCLFCDEAEPYCLDLHHVHPEEKLFAVSAGVSSRTVESLIREAAKCVLLCANCHRKVHHGLLILSSDAARVILG